jgi:glutathione synthase/RimK-type ligase-like ATP-grasp enzyme
MNTPLSPRRICFVTCLAWPEISESDAHVKAELEARGISVAAIPWNAKDQRLEGFEVAIFRSSWDYHHAPEAFLRWLAGWEARGVRFWNPPDLVRWNLTKRYLLDLERRGVRVVPTVLLEDPASLHLGAVLAERGWDEAVVKPVIGASGHGATLVTHGSVHAVASAIDEGRIRRPVIVQPFLTDIRTRGEWSLVFIDGALTHAVLKHPGPGDFRVQPSHGGTSSRAEPSPEIAAAARRALAALPLAPLYARVDGLETDAGLVVMEVEVHEPGLYFGTAPEAAGVFAEAIIHRL